MQVCTNNNDGLLRVQVCTNNNDGLLRVQVCTNQFVPSMYHGPVATETINFNTVASETCGANKLHPPARLTE